MVLIPFPDHARSQKSDTDDQEENQNHYYHQEHLIPTMGYPVKENNQKAAQEQQDFLICSICKSDKVVTDLESGEIICSNCGMIISDKIQQINRPEQRTFNAEGLNDRSRTGIPTSLARHDMGLSTVVGRTDRDASGHKIDAQMRSTMERLRIWDFRT